MKRIEPKPVTRTKKANPITSVNLSDELHEKLELEMRRTGWNKSELIRSILEIYFEESDEDQDPI